MSDGTTRNADSSLGTMYCPLLLLLDDGVNPPVAIILFPSIDINQAFIAPMPMLANDLLDPLGSRCQTTSTRLDGDRRDYRMVEDGSDVGHEQRSSRGIRRKYTASQTPHEHLAARRTQLVGGIHLG